MENDDFVYIVNNINKLFDKMVRQGIKILEEVDINTRKTNKLPVKRSTTEATEYRRSFDLSYENFLSRISEYYKEFPKSEVTTSDSARSYLQTWSLEIRQNAILYALVIPYTITTVIEQRSGVQKKPDDIGKASHLLAAVGYDENINRISLEFILGFRLERIALAHGGMYASNILYQVLKKPNGEIETDPKYILEFAKISKGDPWIYSRSLELYWRTKAKSFT